MDDLQELLATGACARIGGEDDAHSSRTSRSSRLALAHEARITARLHGRRPAGDARERHGSQLVGRGCASPRLQLIPELGRNFPGEENKLTSRVCFCTRKRQQASEALDSARAKAGTVLNFIRAFSYFSTEAITSIVICMDICTYMHMHMHMSHVHVHVHTHVHVHVHVHVVCTYMTSTRAALRA
jgi:hypothetical protein